MSSHVRRVVTGHTPQLKSVVARDEILPVNTRRPGQESCVVWATECVPADNRDPADGALKTDSSRLPQGVVFRVVRYAPGAVGRMHRTSTQDYAVVLSGSIVLAMDDDAEVTLNAGDVLVQRGTRHNWINRSTEPCTVAFVLIDAMPVVHGDPQV